MFRKIFALSEQGAKDLSKGIMASAAADISLMLPVGLIILVLQELSKPLFGGRAASLNVWLYTGVAAVLLTIIFICHLIQYRYTYVSAYSESANRRVVLAEKLRRLPLSFFGQRDLSTLTSTMMSDCTELERTFSHAVPQLFGAALSIVLVGFGLFVMNWRMALSTLFVLPVALLITIGSKGLQSKLGTIKIDAKLAASDGVQECLETIREIRACGKEEEYLAELDKKLDTVVSASIRSELLTGTFIISAQMVLRLGFAAVILVGATLLGRGEIDFLTYLIFLLTASRLYDPLSTVMMQLAEIFNAQIQISRMKEIENQPVQEGTCAYSPKNYDIVFDRVGFSYNENKTVLQEVSFTAKQGEVTALIGPSGGGKSTAAKLAARFWEANSGKITVGGVDISTVEPETLLQSFAIVFQDVVLFNDTILNNIRLGRKEATDEEVFTAAKAARCDEFIHHFSEGYNTIIGENGSTLSGGERQRISIARALLKDAPIILLDEATASLDVENETLIQSALSRLVQNKTVLVIAHRMRTVAGADNIVALDGGVVVEQGTPDQLMHTGKLYPHMVGLQQQNFGWTLN
ncbi:MAG TPA: ABC transporter ATP-binding protein [Patescibacteria group bacterium]|nr:ABC transporter ATP-binding protein [Patescibacteria group bacterium]